MEHLYCKPCPDLPLAGDETQLPYLPTEEETSREKKVIEQTDKVNGFSVLRYVLPSLETASDFHPSGQRARHQQHQDVAESSNPTA